MKKIFAILLALALLIPMGAVVSVSGAKTDVKPFYFVNWDDDITDFDNIYKMPKFNCSAIDANTTSAPMNCTFDGRPASSIKSLAEGLKETFDEYPEGARYINFALFIEALAENCVYLDKGTALFEKWIDEFFKEYKAIGGKIDGLVVDVEYLYCHAHYVNAAATNESDKHYDPQLFDKIVQDPRYKTDIRPLLEERGYNFDAPDGKSEISTMRSNSTNYDIWNAVATNRIAAYIDKAVAPLFTYYPDALVNNYCYPSSKAWNSNVSNNSVAGVGGNTNFAGNTANQNFYLRRAHNDFFISGNNYKYIKPPAYNNAVYEKSTYHSFQFEMMMFKNMFESADNHRISAWIAGYNYNDGKKTTDYIGEGPYYTESLFHIGLLNPQPFIGYTLQNDVGDTYDDAMQIISEALEELTRLVGASDREPIAIFNDWNSGYVLSGMYAGGRNVWRITPDTDKVSLSNFKVEGENPTFRIDGQTITFPQGKIIKTSDIHMIGSCGYWIETPADVKPVIVNDTDRYSKYPSYLEDFESYAAGTEFNGTTAKDKQTWTIDGAALKVEDNGGGKVLAMTGTSTLTQSKLPQKITAGDSYANQQIWEVTITAPTSGILTLLSCDETDGGIKIDGSKVYYDEFGSYQRLSEVSISAGSTYTIRREVDFRNSGAYRSSYTIYDANGNKLGGAENVAMSNVDLPVKTISFSGTGLSGTAYIDDYKLYPTGITTELKVYDAKTGIRETDPNVTRDSDTGYRVAWMNASGENKVVKLYNNDTLVEQANMAPGQDGVLKGVVKGSAVKLSVRVEDAESTDQPDNNDSTNPTDTVDTTTPSAGDVTNDDDGNAKPNEQSGLTGGQIALIVTIAVVAIAGGAFALCWFVIKPEWLVKRKSS